MLPQEAIDQFKKLFKEQFGVELSSEEASLRAYALINLYRAVCVDDHTKEREQ